MGASDVTAVLDELMAREPLFHRTERGTSRSAFEAMTAEDFWEVGASGARYDREHVWSVLEQRYADGVLDDWETSDVACRPLGGDTFLLTYRLRQDARVTRRATIWERTADDWRVIYHQGTEVAGG
ncbi:MULTISPECIES: nuclear transport factor 2 family protein [unclassified Blastococcus]